VSDAELDVLAEAARNRGLKLVRSRVRTPGKRRFGKVGLADRAGKAVFGIDSKGPTAKPEEAEAYLRTLGARDWGASLDVAAPQRKRTAKKPPPLSANDAPRRLPPKKPAARPKPVPILNIRPAKPGDATRLVDLMKLLDHEVDSAGVRKRMASLTKAGLPQLVATLGKEVVGLIGIHRMMAIHRPKPVGRITILVVDEKVRGQDIGRKLVEAAEDFLRDAGCGMVEVTSDDRLTAAHAFYRHMGYERTSIRFVKTL
jgi:GNAT superfamily N-acetyltransferase